MRIPVEYDDDDDTDDDMTDAFCQQIEMRNWFDYYYYMMMMSGNSDPYLKPSEWHYFLKADYFIFFVHKIPLHCI